MPPVLAHRDNRSPADVQEFSYKRPLSASFGKALTRQGGQLIARPGTPLSYNGNTTDSDSVN